MRNTLNNAVILESNITSIVTSNINIICIIFMFANCGSIDVSRTIHPTRTRYMHQTYYITIFVYRYITKCNYKLQ